MTSLSWGLTEPPYAYGLDHGVLHTHSSDLILPWNGLIEVDRDETQQDTAYSAFDGVSFLNVKLGGVYKAKVKAFNFPYEMMDVLGEVEALPGFILTGQMRTKFDFSYRSKVGESNYKLHFVWNAMVSGSSKSRKTLDDGVSVLEYNWDISAVAPRTGFWQPTAFLTVDSASADPDALVDINELIYGTDLVDPVFPSQEDILMLIL